MRVPHAGLRAGRTQWVVLSAATAETRMGNAHGGPKRRVPHVPTAVGGTADGARRSTGDTQNMGESAGDWWNLGLGHCQGCPLQLPWPWYGPQWP
jgi:hypothetical protein